MFGYMTDLERVQMTQVHYIEAEGHDMESLLFHFLDELLFMFCAEPFLAAKVYSTIENLLLNLKSSSNCNNSLANAFSLFTTHSSSYYSAIRALTTIKRISQRTNRCHQFIRQKFVSFFVLVESEDH